MENKQLLAFGPFELIQPIGYGGMCEVWRGQHQKQGTPVAIKIVLANHARHDRYIRIFRDEVRAVASLQHPSIIHVFDYGQLPTSLPPSAPPQLVPGSPYLVMELGDDTLRSWCGRLDWPHLYQILLSLLDALAHAHAQGVIHRDIKPGNILQCQSGTAIKLTDFGLAHAFYGEDNELESQEIIGTPAYMAPEQFERRWRDYGPWTDLYALGCTAYALLTGEPPFGQLEDLEEMMRSHLFRSVPSLPHPEQFPPHFEQWLRCLLAKSPTARFQRAADAAWALMELSHDWEPPPQVSAITPTLPPSSEDTARHPLPILHTRHSRPPSPWDPHTLSGEAKAQSILPWYEVPALPMLRSLHQASTLQIKTDLPQLRIPSRFSQHNDSSGDHTRLNRPDHIPQTSNIPVYSTPQANNDGTEKPLLPPHTAAFQVLSEIPSPLFRRPPLVEDWRRSEEQPLTPALLDVGLGLYGLRTIPWAGREQERDQLWQTLLHVCRKQTPHAILLQGPTGCGKSRLARWLCERAHEVGTATYLKATFHPNADIEDGLEPCLLRYFRGMELSQQDLCERLHQGEGHRLGFSHDECQTIASWLCSQTYRHPSSLPLDLSLDSQVSNQHTPRDTLLFAVPSDYSDSLQISCQDSEDAISTPFSSEHDTQPSEDIVPEGQLYPHSSEENPLWFDEETWHDPTFSSQPHLFLPHAKPEQHALFFRLLQRLSLRRPVILWLDDAHLNRDALLFVQYALQQSLVEPCPLLMVLTLRDDILAKQPDVKSQITQLHLSSRASRLSIGPLSPEHHSMLVRNLLGLQGELAAQVEKRTAGNPMFAVQLVGNWVQRGLLEPTEHGFRLRSHISIPIQSLLLMIHTAIRQGLPNQDIETWLCEVFDLARSSQHPTLIAETAWAHGEYLVLRGRATRAETFFHHAFDYFSRNNDTLGMGRSHYGLALAAKLQLRLDQTQYHLELAQRCFEACYHQQGIADCLRLLGDLCRIRKQFSPALDHYHQSQLIYQRIGSSDFVLCHINQGLLFLQEQNYAKAQTILEEALRTLFQQHNCVWAGAVHVYLLTCFAHQQNWFRWQQHILQAQTILAGTYFCDTDIAEMAEKSAILAERNHAYPEAEAAYRLAQEQWQPLNHHKAQSLHQQRQKLITKHHLAQPAASLNTPPNGTPLPSYKTPDGTLIWMNVAQKTSNIPTSSSNDPLGPTQRTSTPQFDDEPNDVSSPTRR